MLTNPEVLAVDQDPLGIQGTAVPGATTPANTQVWTKPLAGGDVAVALLNRGTTPQTISTTAVQIGLPTSGAYALRDLWQHTTTESAGAISATVAPHSVVLLRVSLNGDPATMAPSTVLSPATLIPTAQAALPLVAPGDSFPVSATFNDNGRLDVWNVKLTLKVPAGWTVTPTAPVSALRLESGESFAASWQVTVAPGTLPALDHLAVTADYGWRSAFPGAPETLQTLSTGESTQVQVPATPPSGTGPLSHHPWLDAASGYLVPRVDLEDAGGGPLTMHGVTYPTGVGTASPSTIDYYVGGNCSTLTATVGIDDSANFDPAGGTAVFQVYGDGAKLYDSGLVTRAAVHQLSVNLASAKVVSLVVGDGGDGGYNDRADWGGLQITCGAPVSTVPSGPWPYFVSSSSESATATTASFW